MKKLIILSAALAVLTGCASQVRYETESDGYLETESLRPETESRYIPLNHEYQTGLWLPYTHFEEYMTGMSEEEYRSNIAKLLTEASDEGINTVYFHVHPNGDSYYQSGIFPRGSMWNGSYDPFEILLEEAHSKDISVQAWLNPLRCQSEEEMQNIPDTFKIKQLTEEKRAAKLVNGRWYLVPAYDETRELICACADEILSKYAADGIHIDDYFYPTSDPEFDREAFEASGSSDLSEWRRDCVSSYVKALYDTVKKHDDKYIFSISPQGNITSDYEKQYANVEKWCSEDGFCDCIIPQIYYGFKNETCPFEKTLHDWENLTSGSNVKLAVGLAAYKAGKHDKWAGAAGENEWIESPDIIERQIELVKSSSASGYVLYK